MINPLESSSSSDQEPEPARPGSRFKLGIVAVGSLLAGGLLAAWWYRKTLLKLQKSEGEAQNPHFGISEHDPTDEA
jgi:hypothetical protein